MTDTRILTWFIFSFAFIVILPITRKLLNPKNSHILDGFRKSFIFIGVASIGISYLYFSDFIKSPEFIFLAILLTIIYFYTGFDKTEYSWQHSDTSITKFNEQVLKKISRSFGGSTVESTDYGFTFVAITPYRLKYQIDAVSAREKIPSSFLITSKSSNLISLKLINLVSLYLIIQALVSEKEIVEFPLLGYETNAVLSVLFSISLTLVILYLEIDSAKKILDSLPKVYSKLLHKEALSKLNKGNIGNVNLNVKDRAQNIIDRRDSSVLKAKKEAVEGKLNSVFGEKETIPLDKKSIARVRLMETVKRILNSTPPWSTVLLKDIAELANGKEEEVEIIIAGLRDLEEVKGIYDIWTKTYHGTSSSHWLITKVLNELPDTATALENVKIYPDGGGEFSFNKKKKNDGA